MNPLPGPQQLPRIAHTEGAASRLRGQAVYVFAYDLGYDMQRYDMQTLLGENVQPFATAPGRRSPRGFTYFRPRSVILPPLERRAAHGPVKVERVVKVFPVGAVSVTLRVDFEVETLDDLIAYHELAFDGSDIEQEAETLARSALEELRPMLIRPPADISDVEAYTVFCLEAPPNAAGTFSAPQWLAEHREAVARLLTAEPGPEKLSDQEAAESTSVHLSYYEHDLLVADWDAALLIDQAGRFAETLHVIELANVQLAEMRAYDRLLDDALERSYRDVARPQLSHRRQILSDIREMRIDLTRFSDELINITKSFGDWHLARVYQSLAMRFHLPEWDASVEGKLRDLDSFYQLLKQDQLNRWMFWLEFAIVALFVVDIIVIFYEMSTRH